MKNNPGRTRESKRWQDIRARAIDATFDADRRRVGERVAIVFRWLFLVVLGVLNNVNPHTDQEAKVSIDVVLAAWGAMNVIVNVLIARGYQPGKQFSLSTMTLDILFAATLVYLSDGFNSPFFLALFLAVITNAVRFGATASFISALVISGEVKSTYRIMSCAAAGTADLRTSAKTRAARIDAPIVIGLSTSVAQYRATWPKDLVRDYRASEWRVITFLG